MNDDALSGGRRFGTAITYGTYDLFHIGHLRLFERLRAVSERLIVGVSTDEFNRLKGKRSLIPYEERSLIVASLRCVDLVIPEESWEQKSDDIRRYGVDVFAMGDDWDGKFDHFREFCEVVYFPRTPAVSSSMLRQSVRLDEDGYPHLQ